MQEEVTQKTIALVFKSSRLTADVLKKAMKDVSGVPESRTTGNTWKNVSEKKAGRSGYGSFEY